MVWCCRTSAVLVAVLMVGCGSSDGQVSASPSHPSNPTPTQQLGPGVLTLDEEIGAVIMVGFEGPVTDSIKADWKQRQFGGLLIVNLNHNGDSASAITEFIGLLRGVSRHRLIAATDQEGGQACLRSEERRGGKECRSR